MFWGYRWVRESVHATRRKQAMHNGVGARLRDYLKVSRPPYSYTAGMRWLKSLGGLKSGWEQYWNDRESPRDRFVFYDMEPQFRRSTEIAQQMYSDSFRNQIQFDRPYDYFTLPQPWPQVDTTITRLICQTYMLENGLAQGDRLSMASSVELRLPLVDYRLVETVIGLRKTHEDINLPPKHWLREAIKDIVPPFVLRRRKRGFSPPWRQWNKALSDAFGNHLADGYLVEHDVLSPDSARYLADKISPPPLGLPVHLSVYALMLEVWCQQMSSVP